MQYNKIKNFTIRLTLEEYIELKIKANSRDLTIADFLREKIFEE